MNAFEAKLTLTFQEFTEKYKQELEKALIALLDALSKRGKSKDQCKWTILYLKTKTKQKLFPPPKNWRGRIKYKQLFKRQEGLKKLTPTVTTQNRKNRKAILVAKRQAKEATQETEEAQKRQRLYGGGGGRRYTTVKKTPQLVRKSSPTSLARSSSFRLIRLTRARPFRGTARSRVPARPAARRTRPAAARAISGCPRPWPRRSACRY